MQNHVRDAPPSLPQAYVERLRKTMDDVEGELWLAGDTQRETMEQLAAEEKAVSRELEEMERYFEQCMHEGTTHAPRPHTARGGERLQPGEDHASVHSRVNTTVGASELPPEVLAVERMLQENPGMDKQLAGVMAAIDLVGNVLPRRQQRRRQCHHHHQRADGNQPQQQTRHQLHVFPLRQKMRRL